MDFFYKPLFISLALTAALALAPPALRASEGSLFPLDDAKANLTTDQKALGIGDLVTILISERASASDTSSHTTSRKAKSEPKIETSNMKILGDIFGKLGIENENSSSGGGTTTHSGTLSAQLTARVVDELPNGNLLIEGRREIVINNESQFIKITGLARIKDIGPGNTIQSTLLSDARISYYGKGPIAEKGKQGVLQKLFDILF